TPGLTRNLTEFMAGDGADITNPGLDLDDFFGAPSGTGPDGNLYQLPDQQFANLYWFRKDWFDDPDNQAAFREKYGYDLGVPLNWSAYEDIAEFFTNDVGEIDGVKIYGHMDYGKRGPDLGWRMTDAWLSMAGTADLGIPNGRPVDEWGIRMEKGSCNPSGASVARGGAVNSPAAVYAVTKWNDWLRKYAPPGAADLDFYQSLPALSRAMSRSRCSGTRPSPPAWSRRRARATTRWTTRAIRCGGWHPRRPARTGRKACSAAIRTRARGRCSSLRRSSAARPRGCSRSSPSPRRWTSRRAMLASPSCATARSGTRPSPSARRNSAAWSSSTARPTAWPGRRPA